MCRFKRLSFRVRRVLVGSLNFARAGFPLKVLLVLMNLLYAAPPV